MSLRFVIVDDDLVICRILQKIIEQNQLGTVVEQCNDGLKGERIIREYQPDIALVDLLLPGQDGVELIEKVSAAATNTSFIMVSQATSEQLITKAYEAGIEFFIHKPINVLETVSVINKVQEHRKLKQIMSLMHQTISQYPHVRPAVEEGPKNLQKTRIYKVFSDLGIIGEAGVKDIYRMVQLILKKGTESKSYQLCDIYQQMSEGMEQDAKAIEQRVRRATTKSLHNLANLGIDDYYNEIFQSHSSSLFDFKEVRQEMNFILGKSQYRGKINVKKFIEGLLFIAEV
ncbi:MULTISPECIES: response regulator [Pelosinus]|uniref:YcbB domain-containing protein n=1 Tax=Pelosinus fermentans B4 TaxID=1149862 RepID=I8RKR1_9FIRM|nr:MULTISPECIES: response regulator [Pelosinus]EIW20823.1 YcbB domain-containing protein [Pelosinus fermentans B4]EIW25332.1 response regulator receiver protein [Pelosinus fermentans A11]OAM93590.1 response regulator receiver protein [Pelosinus fermentans DSM 17108]SDQ83123.1 two-component system, response regulator YcbB [Pelosinus fermentans]